MITILIISSILFIYALYEYRNIQKVNLSYKDFKLEKQMGLKIIFLSDIQYDFKGLFFQKKLMRKVVAMINQESPDLVLFGGDYIHQAGSTEMVFDYLKDIHADKIGILGNHDYKDVEGVKEGCEKAGINLLINETVQYKGINITGLDDLRDGNPKMPKISDIDNNILLIHEPDDFENYIDDYTFDITLSGHHHAGQVNLFGLYAPIVPSKYKNRYLHGLIERKDKYIYVSSGLGGLVFFLPIRFFAKPEIVVIEA